MSDAGQKETVWKPGGIANPLRGFVLGAASLPIIERVITIMNAKENRHMRLGTYSEIERTWLVEIAHGGQTGNGVREYLDGVPSRPRRRILFVRLKQTMRELLAGIPKWRFRELADRVGCTLTDPLPPVGELLSNLGVRLETANSIHAGMGGDSRIGELNRIATNFTALSKTEIEGLNEHARWQVHAMHALYWIETMNMRVQRCPKPKRQLRDCVSSSTSSSTFFCLGSGL